MAHADRPGKPAPTGLQELRMRLGSDARKRPLVHVLMPDGRVTEYRETAVVLPEGPEDERESHVYALLVNGHGEVLFDAATGEPAILPAPVVPMTLRWGDNPERRLSYDQVAGMAGVSKSTVQRAVYDGTLPMPDKLSARRVAFRQADIERWLGTMGKRSTASADKS